MSTALHASTAIHPRDALNGIKPARPLARAATLNTAGGAGRTASTFDLNRAKSAAPTSFGPATPASFQTAMSAITAAKSTANAEPESPEDAKLRATAETLVNQMFMGSMLKQMRSSPFKDDTMSGGKAGDAYAGLFDQNLSAKAGGGMGKGLVDVMVKHLKGNHAAAPTTEVGRAQAEYLKNRRKAQAPSQEHDDAATVNRAA